MDSFLSDDQIAELHGLLRTGYNTVQRFQDPAPIVQFRRHSIVTGRFEDVGEPVQLITVKFGLREKSVSPTNLPLVDTRSDGDMKLWASDFQPQVDDRFTLDGITLRVSAVYPQQFGVIKAEVKLSQ